MRVLKWLGTSAAALLVVFMVACGLVALRPASTSSIGGSSAIAVLENGLSNPSTVHGRSVGRAQIRDSPLSRISSLDDRVLTRDVHVLEAQVG